MANPSVSVDIEAPSTFYSFPPPPKYSEIYNSKSNETSEINIPSTNLPSGDRQTQLMGPPLSRPNLAASSGTGNIRGGNYLCENDLAAIRSRREVIMVRCCFATCFLIILLVFGIIKLVQAN